ncbi:MAG: Na/Pi cotransporter family protein [Candidatus Omnitrophica bacterium]|nr:Na/Pi cotransporter family protein [Candidatus Omnitrophota bacterium]MBU1933520.1 Na/Pi cotransporter family protein [Candidatus Omnitrophota bacterium]
MIKEVIFGMLGGLGLLLFGMTLMSEGLQKVAGAKLKQILKLLTDKPLAGVLVGTGVTAIIQSSSATTVMVVGFVNAGLMSLRQAIGVIMGANIGTTITAQLIAFHLDKYALPVIGIGFALMFFGRQRKIKFWGQVLLGFGLLFFGLTVIKDMLAPLKEMQAVSDFFVRFSANPMLGILAGLVITLVLQSSSAVVGFIQALALIGVIDFPIAIAAMLGSNIGTTITAQFASIGSSITSRRAAMAHTLFNVLGVLIVLPFFYSGIFERIVDMITPGSITNATIMRNVANAHTVFNVFNTLLFLPFIGLFVKLSTVFVPGEVEVDHAQPKYLEEHLLATPSIALDQSVKEIVRMLGISRVAVKEAMRGFFDKEPKFFNKVRKKEDAIDNLQVEITNYVVKISQHSLTPEESERLPVLLHSVNDVERIGDHAENLAELAERALEEKLPFSDSAINDLHTIYNEVDNMMEDVKEAFLAQDEERAKDALVREETINRLQLTLRANHIQRLGERHCVPLSGVIFLDFVNNLEKIGDHLTNVAQAVRGVLRWDKMKSAHE